MKCIGSGVRNLMAGIKKFGKARPAGRSPPRTRLTLEALEARELMSAMPLSWTAPFGSLNGNSSNAIVLTVVNNNVQIFDNGQLVASQTVADTSSITLTLPTYCQTYSGSTSVTWCTRSVSTNRYALYRWWRVRSGA